jgi:SAM-dependent methyltransferase
MQRFWHAGKLAALDQWMIPGIDAQRDLVLEIGCGAGNLLTHIGASAARLAALDLSRGALEFTANRLAHLKKPAWVTIQAFGEHIPLQDHCAAWVVLSEVVEHLADPHDMLAETWRVLQPGGRLFLTTPNYHSLWPLLEKTVDFLNLAPKMAGEQHISRFNPTRLDALLRQAGWQIERLASFYTLSPFIAIFSEKAARYWLAKELERNTLRGMLLALVARKPEQVR